MIFLLLFFKRNKRILPNPVISKVSDFLRYNKKTIAEINTLFPGVTKTDINKNLYVEGGLILLKLKQNNITENTVKRGIIIIKYNDEHWKYYEEAFQLSINLQN